MIAETDSFDCVQKISAFFKRDVTFHVIGQTVIDEDANLSDGTKYDASVYDIKFLDNNPSVTADSHACKSRPRFGNGLSSCQRYLVTNVNSFEKFPQTDRGYNPDVECSAA